MASNVVFEGLMSRKRTYSDTYPRIRSNSAPGERRSFQDTRSDGGSTALEITDDHRAACSDHILILADHRRDHLDLEAVAAFAFDIERGLEDEQIRRLLRLQHLLGEQTVIPLPIGGFTYNAKEFDFVISVDELQDISDAGTFKGLKPPLKTSTRSLIGTSMTSDCQITAAVAHPNQQADDMDSPLASLPMLGHSGNSCQWTAPNFIVPGLHEMNAKNDQPKGKGKERAVDVPATSSGTANVPHANRAAKLVETSGRRSICLSDQPIRNAHQDVALQPMPTDGTRVRQQAALPPVFDDYGTLLRPSAAEQGIQAALYRVRGDLMLQYSKIGAMVHRALFLGQVEHLLQILIPRSAPGSDEELYYTRIAELKRGIAIAIESYEDVLPIHPYDLCARISEA